LRQSRFFLSNTNPLRSRTCQAAAWAPHPAS
jgi:hypothetical protein